MQQYTAHVQCVAWAILGDGDVVPSLNMSGCATRSSLALETRRSVRYVQNGTASERASAFKCAKGAVGASRPSTQCVVAKSASGFCKDFGKTLTSRRAPLRYSLKSALCSEFKTLASRRATARVGTLLEVENFQVRPERVGRVRMPTRFSISCLTASKR